MGSIRLRSLEIFELLYLTLHNLFISSVEPLYQDTVRVHSGWFVSTGVRMGRVGILMIHFVYMHCGFANY